MTDHERSRPARGPSDEASRRASIYVADENIALWADWQEFLAAVDDNMSGAVMAAVAEYRPFRIWRAGKQAGRREAAEKTA